MAESSISKGSIQSVERALRILGLFKASGEIGITEMASAVDLPKGTVHGLVKTLEKMGFVEQNPMTQKYRLGAELFQLGLVAASRMDLRKAAAEKARQLCDQLGETVYVSVLLGGACVIATRCIPDRPFLLVPEIGTSVPAHCTAMGKVLLAALSDEQLEETVRNVGLEKFTQYTIDDLDELKQTLEGVVKDGYSVTHQEALLGLSCVAAPIRDYTGEIVASLGMASSTQSLEKRARLKEVIEAVVIAARETSKAMGYE